MPLRPLASFWLAAQLPPPRNPSQRNLWAHKHTHNKNILGFLKTPILNICDVFLFRHSFSPNYVYSIFISVKSHIAMGQQRFQTRFLHLLQKVWEVRCDVLHPWLFKEKTSLTRSISYDTSDTGSPVWFHTNRMEMRVWSYSAAAEESLIRYKIWSTSCPSVSSQWLSKVQESCDGFKKLFFSK